MKKPRSMRGIRVAKSKLLCAGKLSDERPCPKRADVGKNFCRWHDPEDETWREIYERLQMTFPEQKTDIVLQLIEDHPENILVLPERDGQKANLTYIDLSKETINKRKEQCKGEALWWDYDNDTLKLENANLRGAILFGANFQSANMTGAQLQMALMGMANLKEAMLYLADLQEADLYSADLQGACLDAANLPGARLVAVNIQKASLIDTCFDNAHLEATDLREVDLFRVSLKNAFIRDIWLDRTRMRRDSIGSSIGEEVLRNYSAAKQGYLVLKQNFDDLGDYEASSWAYRKERRMEKLEAWHNGYMALSQHKFRMAIGRCFKFSKDLATEWLCDYGESVWRVLGWMAALLFVIGPLVFSSLGGIVWNKELTSEYFALSSWPRFWLWYRTYLLYSLDTFTTGSFSGLQPSNDVVKLASGFLAIAGIVLAGLLGFVAGNRIRRS